MTIDDGSTTRTERRRADAERRAGAALSRARTALLVCLLALGAVLPGCAAPGGGARGPYPLFSEYEDWEVRRVRFVGDLELPVDSLRAVVVTRPSRCWLFLLPVCLPFTNIGRDPYHLDLQELARDVVRLQLYYRDHGYYGTRVVPSVDPTGEEEVAVRFAIAPGDQVILDELEVAGTEEIIDPERAREMLPLDVGEPFRRIGFLQSADTLRSALHRLGYAYADVLRNYSLDTIADVAQAQFVAIPGPLVHVDTILFAGVNRLSQETLRRQITLEEGELLRLAQLNESQRSLYDLQMVSFAALEIAPDSLQRDRDSTTATLLARVVEAPQYVVDAAVGIGTVECLRTEASWLNRNFLGGGRSLELSGHLSKIGVGDPLNWGLEESLCTGANRQPLGTRGDILGYLNYRVAADFLQPRLLNTRNELAVLLQWERLTELNAYLRESVSGQVLLSRQIGRNQLLNTTLTVARGRTLANPVIFCIEFDICTTEDFRELERFRWSNALSVTALWNRSRSVGVGTRGFNLRGSVDWASPLLLSDNRFLRFLGEGSIFRPWRPGWEVGGNLRVGSFLQGQLGLEGGYIPPELRFYAGGPNSVRGFPRNALGPTAYVWTQTETEDRIDRSAVGGTQMVVGSVEVRGPSPIYSDFFRMAAFVDAGQVWAPGSGAFESARVCNTLLCITPGVGLRIGTPVGPIRLDVAYNPYDPPVGPLYFVDPVSGALVPIDPAYQPDPPSFLQRLQFSFAVGQAF